MLKILILTDFSSGFSRNLLRGIVRYSQEVNHLTFYRMPLYYRMVHGDKGVVEWAKRWKADAIIAQLRELDIELFRDLNIPIVVQNYKERMSGVCNLTGDYIGTGRLAADFFISRGSVNFAFYGMKDTVWSRERRQGYGERLKEKNFMVHEHFEPVRNSDTWDYNLDKLGKWLLSLPKPISIFACDDQFALQISETCKMVNLSIPDEIAILGVDNDELLCNISTPALSSIVLDEERGGYAAVEMLYNMISNRVVSTFDITIKALHIESRASTDRLDYKDQYILDVIYYIEKNYNMPISVNDLVQIVPLSRRVLEKRFRQSTGSSIYQYIQRYRIERFANMLVTTNKPIDEISFMCGFDDCKNISRIFMKYKNTTPSGYIKLYRDLNKINNN